VPSDQTSEKDGPHEETLDAKDLTVLCCLSYGWWTVNQAPTGCDSPEEEVDEQRVEHDKEWHPAQQWVNWLDVLAIVVSG
jgi:hypothetical protein